MDVSLRLRLDDLYARYVACIDEARFSEWPDFFTEDCVYKIIPRENYDANLPLATVAAESRGMLIDRVYGIENTLYHQPHYQRHIVSGLFVKGVTDGVIEAQANYCVMRVKLNQLPEVFNCGRYVDKIVEENGALLFKQKLCVFDSEMIANSLIYPI
jgi:salicylate 5-hydroxylase small subunit